MDSFRQSTTRFLDTIADFDSEASYSPQSRNLNDGRLSVAHIQHFMIEYGAAILKDELPYPDLILGIACGASELAFASSSVLGTDVELIRYSNKRDDKKIMLIPEIHRDLAGRMKSKSVGVVDDIIRSASSLNTVMEAVELSKPENLIGAAALDTSYANGGANIRLERIARRSGFNVYKRS